MKVIPDELITREEVPALKDKDDVTFQAEAAVQVKVVAPRVSDLVAVPVDEKRRQVTENPAVSTEPAARLKTPTVKADPNVQLPLELSNDRVLLCKLTPLRVIVLDPLPTNLKVIEVLSKTNPVPDGSEKDP